MNDLLIPYWKKLVEQKELFLAELDAMPEDMRPQKPAEGWSAIQVMEHIMIAESGTLAYMKKKTSGGWQVLELAGDEHNSNSRKVNERLQSAERYRAPSVLPEPQGNFPYEGMKTFWNNQRIEMDKFISSLEPAYYDRLLFRQPVAGLLNLYQALEFMTYHIMHHIPQLHRIKEAWVKQ